MDRDVQGGWTGTGNIDSFPFVNSGDPSLLEDIDWDGLDNALGTVDDGLRLAIASPAVDAGSNAALPTDMATDLSAPPVSRTATATARPPSTWAPSKRGPQSPTT